jgi:hypothetical protein
VHVLVDLDVTPPSVGLADPADCARFDVQVHGGDAGDAVALDGALRAQGAGAAVGTAEADIAVAAVRRMATGAVGPSWEADFGAMLDYARTKGWLSDDGAMIRAHVERG